MSIQNMPYLQQRFIDELLADPRRNATAAYARVYECAVESASANAARLMADERIQAEIARRDAEGLKRAGMTADEVRRHIRELATADPRDLIDFRRGACRHCHGAGFKRQRTPAEMERDLRDYLRKNRRDVTLRVPGVELDELALNFDYEGGVGFNPNRRPHPECPECFGRGVGYTYPKDLRDVPPEAARLFAGIKETKDGFEIKTRNQDVAIKLAAQIAGLLDKGTDEDGDAPPPAEINFAVEDASAPPSDGNGPPSDSNDSVEG